MKILLSQTYFSPYISGLTLYAEKIAEILTDNGCRVTAICIKHQPDLKSVEERAGIRVVRVNPWWKWGKGFVAGGWIIKSLMEIKDSDVVIINLPQVEGLITALYAKMLKKKLVVVYHCDINLQGKWGARLTQAVIDKTSLWITQMGDKVVTSTEDYAERSRLLPGFKKKTGYIYPLVNKGKGTARDKRSVLKRISAKSKCLIGVVGRLSTEKGLEYLLMAIPYLSKKLGNNNFLVAIAGPTDTPGENEYSRQIRERASKMEGEVKILGNLSQGELAAFYSLMKVLVLPSVNSTESLGMVQIEAMLSGVPVVASDLPGVRIPVLKTGMGRLAEPRSPKSIAEAIYEVITENENLKKLVGTAEKEFAPAKIVRFWQTLVSEQK
jgi:glycosyltransferase involved in cell wall biosynthesis